MSKKSFLLLVFVWVCMAQRLYAQPIPNRLSIGLSGGYIISTTNFSLGLQQGSESFSKNSFGIMVRHMSSKYAGIQSGLFISEKGFGLSQGKGDTARVYTRSFQYLEIPFMTHFEVGSKRLKLALNLGPQLGILINNKEHFNREVDSLNFNAKAYGLSLKNNKSESIQLGIAGGIGVNYDFGPFIIQVEGRYYQGFTNVLAPRSFSSFTGQTYGGYVSILYNVPLKNKPQPIDPEAK